MSEQHTEPAPQSSQQVQPAPTTEQPQSEQTEQQPAKADTDWKAQARKWEDRAKENLARIEAQERQWATLQKAFGSPEGQQPKPEDLVSSVQERVERLERENAVNSLARTHGITDESDIARLIKIADPELRADIAARLKPSITEPAAPAAPQTDPGQGARPGTSQSARDAEYEQFFPSNSR